MYIRISTLDNDEAVVRNQIDSIAKTYSECDINTDHVPVAINPRLKQKKMQESKHENKIEWKRTKEHQLKEYSEEVIKRPYHMNIKSRQILSEEVIKEKRNYCKKILREISKSSG